MLQKFKEKCLIFGTLVFRRTDRRFIIELIVIIALLFFVGVVQGAWNSSQFKVVYSLDRRQNDQEIIRIINDAHKYVYFAVYYFTKTDIADALVRAKQRGLDIRGITDAAASLDSNKTVVSILRDAGIGVETQKHLDGIMHIKAIVTDKAYASGSYNWTDAATEANDEVLEIGTNKELHDQYLGIIKKVIIKNQ